MNGEAPKLLDTESLDVLRDAIGDSIQNIIKLYLQDVPHDLQSMQAALVSNDLETLRRLAHSLKATSANLGAMQTSSLATKLESSITDGEIDPSILSELLTKLTTSFDQTRSLLENWPNN